MPIDLKYRIPPTFIVDGVDYATCGNLRRPLPFTGPNGIPELLPLQMYSPFIEARFYRVLRFDEQHLQRARQFQQQLYYVSTGNFLGSNESRNAFIKSFSFSIENGYGGTLEIIDTSGNDFVGFYNTVYKNKCLDDKFTVNNNAITPAETFIVSINVGYVFVNSDGQRIVYQTFVNAPSKEIAGIPFGPYINFFLTQIDVSVNSGKWKYNLILKSADAAAVDKTVDKRIGGPGQLVPFMRAAEIMLDGNCPPKLLYGEPTKDRVLQVSPPKGANGMWQMTGEKGAGKADNASKKGSYAGYNLNPLDAIRKNMDTYITKNGKGAYMFYPSGINSSALFLVEAESNFCTQRRGSVEQCSEGAFLGTYVVNGGDFSPVISFDPKISLVGIPNKVTGGQAGGGANVKAVEVRDICGAFGGNEANEKTNAAKKEGQTIVVAGAAANDAWNKEAPRNIPRLQAQAGVAAMAAENTSKPATAGAISATLTIQGEPRFLWSLNIKGAAIKIIFINPFAPYSPNFGLDTDWLANPKINSMISDGYYMVNGCDHTISDGKWTTTLKLTQSPTNEIKG